jgi:hypothetical protein
MTGNRVWYDALVGVPPLMPMGQAICHAVVKI